MIGALFVVAVVLSALYSGLETGIYTSSRLRLYLDARADLRPAKQARRLLSDMPRLLTVLLVANNLANQAATHLALLLLVRWGVESPEVVGATVVTAVLFLLAESFPKSAFRRSREALLYPAMPVLVATHAVLSPLAAPLSGLTRLLSRAVQRDRPTPAGAREAMLEHGAEEGFLTEFQERVARGVLAMRSRSAADEAVPLDDYPRARVGVPGVELPENCREHRVLVFDSGGTRVIGWVAMAALWERGRFRAPRRRETRSVARVAPNLGLDRVFGILDRSKTPFAITDTEPGARVLDVTRLRRRVMGILPDA